MENQENLIYVPLEIVGEQNEEEIVVETIHGDVNKAQLPPEENDDEFHDPEIDEFLEEYMKERSAIVAIEENEKEFHEADPEIDEFLEEYMKERSAIVAIEENKGEFHGEKRKKQKKGDDDDLDNFEYEVEVDAAVDEFVDEYMRERNAIPESDNDEDSDDDDPYLRYQRKSHQPVDKLALGSAFFTCSEFKETVLSYALRNGFNIVQDRWDTLKCAFKCGVKGKCKWRVYCSYDTPKRMWIVKTTYNYHKCTPNGKCKMLKSPVIARLFREKLRHEPNFMPEDIQNYIKEKWNIVSTRNQCQRGRTLALRWLESEYVEQFAHIRGYVKEIETSNPGSVVFVDTIPNSVGEDVFNRFYVCFEKIRSCWRGSCRPVIGLDGTFLKTAVKGVLLAAVGHDANNQIYPIAWAVVQAETTISWLWFIQQIKKDLCLGDGSSFVIISDRSKGLISAVKDELPNAEHRKCVKHIVDNLKKTHGKLEFLKPLIWNLAWSYNVTDYEENLKNIKDYNISLYNSVLNEEPKTWTRAFFRLGSFCDDVDNNSTESFNATITTARAKSLIPMLEMIRRQAMERITKRKLKANKHEGMYTKYVATCLREEREDAEKCKTYTATHGLFEVHLKGDAHRINMNAKTCTCYKWQLTGIPCEHAYGVMIDKDLDPEDYVTSFFSVGIWQDNYEVSNIPVRGPRVWLRYGLPLVKAPPEPELPGRKKKKKKRKFPRTKSVVESPKKKKQSLSRAGKKIHCSSCGEVGHNALGCKKYPKTKIKKEPGVDGPPKKKQKKKEKKQAKTTTQVQVSQDMTQQSQTTSG